EALMDEVAAMAERIAKNGPLAVSEAKKIIHVGQSLPLDGALMMEQRAFGALCATDDQTEGTTAFLDKRAAEFRGR
ncbi:MAG: enoyl-CoA hydratase-related protein, partial [Myxococcota bacterium]